ncbi:MAG: hypothetical protein A2842_01625 [Candidatus Wildermuthbacteria bacterium RIFCSPHIGHO2_01_FULL_48_25]|nr:MAG: hypothetical protein A2842_01625 [Candidatus Wildermuthbacteria bacterium RIFCSPHIGHO2_01_FULL_48_25]
MSKFNPFTPNNPVHSNMFIGRAPEFDAIDRALAQALGGNPSHILILGERGIGKTSLLNVAGLFARGGYTWNDRKHNFLVARISLNENICLVDFAINLRNSIQREIDKENPGVASLKKAWDFLSRFEAAGIAYKHEESIKNNAQIIQEFAFSLVDTIKSLKDSAQKDGLVILIDEADKASLDLSLGSSLKSITETLAAEDCNNILFVVTGLPGTRDVLTKSHESSLRLFQEFNLGPLLKDETITVIESGLQEAKKISGKETQITDEAKDLIYVFSEGYPHFVQQIGYSVFEVDEDGLIDKGDVNTGVFAERGAIKLIGDRYYAKFFYKDISVESQREILSIMAEKWNDWITKKEIKEKFSNKEKTLDNGVRSLIEKGIIIPREGFKGQYRLQWASFAFWIKNHRKTGRQ